MNQRYRNERRLFQQMLRRMELKNIDKVLRGPRPPRVSRNRTGYPPNPTSRPDPQYRRRERVSDPSGPFFFEERPMEIHIVNVASGCKQIGDMLGGGHAEADRILKKVHRSYPSCAGFRSWCSYANRAGLTGEKIERKYLELGSSGAELIIYVLEQQMAHEKPDVLTHAASVLMFSEIRKTVTW